MNNQKKTPIGVFDSGYGGLTILKEFQHVLPEYDYLFIGDNARAPYGSRSFSVIYQYTLQAVKYLFSQGCELVILACNTASAKALRSIQQRDLPTIDPNKRVLGVIRPTVEVLGKYTSTGEIGVLGTPGTIASQSYDIEIKKLYPDYKVYGHACKLWAALVESGEANSDGADYFVRKDIEKLLAMGKDIDTIILGCTHYPLLLDKIKKYVPKGISVISQGEIIANSLKDYLHRHTSLAAACTKGGTITYCTTEDASKFDDVATIFIDGKISAQHVEIDTVQCK